MDAAVSIGKLDSLPRARLMTGETPLEPMPNLARELERPNLFVKRDDLTGLAFGGNKVRQLEFYLGEAQARDADTVVITGAVQSNFVRLAAASARKLGMECHIQLEDRVPKNDPTYKASGNVLIDRILGATLHEFPEGEDEAAADRRLEEIADGLRKDGRKPYVIHLAPGHAPLGALGYVVAARELLAQCEGMGIAPDEVVLASGSGHTHGGMLFGLRALGSRARVTGICVRRDAGRQFQRIAGRCEELASLLEVENPVGEGDVIVTDAHLGAGYGRASEEVLDAMGLAARSEGMITDPVYTAKAFCGFVDRARESDPSRTIVFIHTGGTPAIFAYERELTSAFSANRGL